MNDYPEASTASQRQSVQASRDVPSDNTQWSVPQRPGQGAGFGVRRGHSDGEILQCWNMGPTTTSNVQDAGSNIHRVSSVQNLGLQNTGNSEHRPTRTDSWHEFFNSLDSPETLQAFLNNSSSSNGDAARVNRARQQAMMMLVEQRKRAQQAREIQARRRATTIVPPRGPPVGLRRHAASASGGPHMRAPSDSFPNYRTMPQGPMPPQSPVHAHPRRESRGDEYTIPRWQPDSEVSNCPICHHPFTFFYRKHHCRKCGRVVCANCSPHRITIPRQFIVHPPSDDSLLGSEGDSDEGGAVDLNASGRFDSALGGGQEVRLCNPCVPDPNPLPPPAYPQPSANHLTSFPHPDAAALQRNAWPSSPSTQYPNSVYQTHAHPNSSTGPTSPMDVGRGGFQRNPLPSHGRRRSANVFSNPLASDYQSSYGSAPNARPSFLAEPRPPHHRSHHRQHASIAAYPSSRYRSMLDVTSPLPPLPVQEPPRPPPRQIAEEDECPICHEELPPKGPNGEETQREAHVASCIETHFSTSRPRSESTARPEAAVAAAVAASSATPAQAGSTQGSSAAVAGPSQRRRNTGMLVYQATEKDCIGEDGATQECVICFEDFEPGAEMGRLECLCKFHKTCIRAWWDTKGVGACPVHQGGLT